MTASTGLDRQERRFSSPCTSNLLLAHLTADVLLVGDGLLVEAYALDGHRLGVDRGPLGVQGDRVLVLADVRAEGAAAVRLGDGLTSSDEDSSVLRARTRIVLLRSRDLLVAVRGCPTDVVGAGGDASIWASSSGCRGRWGGIMASRVGSPEASGSLTASCAG
jgi:hypothetical protein